MPQTPGGTRSVIAFGGRRIDAANPEAVRFPFENRDAVLHALKSTFAKEAPICLAASAACGSDLLALEAASQLRINPIRIVLPFPSEIFRRVSVVDRPNSDYWGDLFDRLIELASSRGDLVVLLRDEDDLDAFSAANQAILDEAKRAARQTDPRARLLAVIAWEGASRGMDDATDDFRRIALREHFEVEEISTLEPKPLQRSTGI